MQILRSVNKEDFSYYSNNQYPIFFTSLYASFLKETGSDLIIIHSQKYNAAIPFRIWHSRFLKLATCLYQPLKNGEPLSQNEEKSFLDELITFARKSKFCDRITAPDNTAVFQAFPSDSIYAPFGTYKRTLYPLTIQEVVNSFQPRYRTAIRQAKKLNIIIKYGASVLEDYYLIYKKTADKTGLYTMDMNYFKKMLCYFGDNTFVSVAYYNNNPVGCLMLVYTVHSAQYLHGGSVKEAPSGTIKYLHADAMEYLLNKQVKEYDFVGARITKVIDSKLYGIQKFKSHFGTQLVKGYIWKKDINIPLCKLYDKVNQLKHKLQKKSPPIDIIEQENKIIEWIKSSISINNQEQDRKIKDIHRILIKKTTVSKLVIQLEKSGIKKGDSILVHSSLSKLGNIQNGPFGVIQALKIAVGENGNIAMPAFSYRNSMIETALNENYIYDAEKTPSVTGKITEVFRTMPGTHRSIHPTHSVCAYGPMADEITKDHFIANTNFGHNTPFDKLRQLNGKIVGLGINIGPVTIYHMIEDLFPNEFKGVYFPEPFNMKVIKDGTIQTKSVFVHDSRFHKKRIDKNPEIEHWFNTYFTQNNILHKYSFGNGTMWWMDIQQLIDKLIKLKSQGITIYQIPSKINEKKYFTYV